MLWFIISIVWIFIAVIAFFGDYKEKELKKDYEKYNQLFKK